MLADLLAKHIVRVPVVGPPIARMIQATTAGFVQTSLGRRVSRATGRRFPFGYFLVAARGA